MNPTLLKSIALVCISLLPCAAIADDASQKINPITNRAYIIAFERYPNMADSSSDMHKRVASIYQRALAARSIVFSDPNWPLLIADKAYSSFGTINSEPIVSPTPTEKYEKGIRKNQESPDPTIAAAGNYEWAAYQATLSGDTVKAAELMAQAQGLLAQQIQADDMTRALNRINRTMQRGVTVYVR